MKTTETIEKILNDSISVKSKMRSGLILEISRIAKVVISCLKKKGKLIIFGNGGSAADAQHIAAELIGRFKKDRKALAAIALTTNTSVITSLSNDYDFELIFAKQIEGLANKNDVAIGISTSGNAKNVILGIRKARQLGLETVAFTGETGGALAKVCKYSLRIPSEETARIQEAHITVGHIICELIENEFFK